MKWRRNRRMSEDVIDRRGAGGGGMGGMALGAGGGIGGIVLLVLFMLLNGGGDAGTGGGGLDMDDIFQQFPQAPSAQGGPPAQGEERTVKFMSAVLDDAQNYWEDTFESGGKDYERAKLVVFTQGTHSACGGATAQIGPHYCPADKRVYLDVSFFQELSDRFGAPGDFAQAYVLAHEIGHHVQNELGINQRVHNEQRSNPDEANELSVRLELQADCLAGVWAHTVYERDKLSEGDMEEGLDAAAAVGDDRLQKQAGQDVNQESWTHGSSEQRQTWFKRGFDTGDPNNCDTFSTDI